MSRRPEAPKVLIEKRDTGGQTSRFEHQAARTDELLKLENGLSLVYRRSFYLQILLVLEAVVGQRLRSVAGLPRGGVKIGPVSLSSIPQASQISSSFRSGLLREEPRVFLILRLALDGPGIHGFGVEAGGIDIERGRQKSSRSRDVRGRNRTARGLDVRRIGSMSAAEYQNGNWVAGNNYHMLMIRGFYAHGASRKYLRKASSQQHRLAKLQAQWWQWSASIVERLRVAWL